MKLPNWNDTLTVYMQDGGKWSKRVYENCFFQISETSSHSDKQLLNERSLTARIPDKVNAVIGSIVVKGRVNDEIPDNTSGNELLKKYPQTAFRVNFVFDNTAFALPHTRLGGK